MADMTRLEEALRNAHEAGDVEAATKLAGALRQAMAQSPEPQQGAEPQQLEAPQEDKDENFLEKIDQGLLGVAQGAVIDPLIGLGQLGAHALQFGDAYDKNIVKKQADWYKKKRKELGGKGKDIARGFGMVAPALVPGLGAAALGTKALGALGKSDKLRKGLKATEDYGEAVFSPVTAAAKLISKKKKLSPAAQKAADFAAGKNMGVLKSSALRGAQAPLTQVSHPEDRGGDSYLGDKLGDLALGTILGGVLGGTLGRYSTKTLPETTLGKELSKRNLGTAGQRSGHTTVEDIYSRAPGGGNIVQMTQDKALKEIKPVIKQKLNDFWSKAKITDPKPFERIKWDILKDRTKLIKKDGSPEAKENAKVLGEFLDIFNPRFLGGKTASKGSHLQLAIGKLEKLAKDAADDKNMGLSKMLTDYTRRIRRKVALQSGGEKGLKELQHNNRLWSQFEKLETAAKNRGHKTLLPDISSAGIGSYVLGLPNLLLGAGLSTLPGIVASTPKTIGALTGGLGRHVNPLIQSNTASEQSRTYANGGLAAVSDDYIYDMIVPHKK